MPKILVVESDEVLRDFLRSRLEAEWFAVVTAADGEEALRAMGLGMPDAVILDLMPEADGLLLYSRLRADPGAPRIPILILCGEGVYIQKIPNLDLDADDFMTKPYNDQELCARLRTLLRRTARASRTRMIRTGDIEIDMERYVVTVSGKEVRFTTKEFELLRILMEANGRVLRRAFLLEQVWGYGRSTDVESRTIDVHVRRVRQKLGPEGANILTVRNVGYRFDMSRALLMQRVAASAPSSSPR